MACGGIVCRGECLADIVTICRNWTPEREIDHPQRDVGGWGRVELRVGYNVMLFFFLLLLSCMPLLLIWHRYIMGGGGGGRQTQREAETVFLFPSVSLCLRQT